MHRVEVVMDEDAQHSRVKQTPQKKKKERAEQRKHMQLCPA